MLAGLARWLETFYVAEVDSKTTLTLFEANNSANKHIYDAPICRLFSSLYQHLSNECSFFAPALTSLLLIILLPMLYCCCRFELFRIRNLTAVAELLSMCPNTVHRTFLLHLPQHLLDKSYRSGGRSVFVSLSRREKTTKD